MPPTNGRLVERSKNIILEALGVSEEDAIKLLNKYGNIKRAFFGRLKGIVDVHMIQENLNRNQGNMRESLLDGIKLLTNN